MKRKIKATLYYTIDKQHPDYKYYKNPDLMQEISDTYIVDTDNFYGNDHLYSYIKNDLMLVAGGGYDTDHIHNVIFHCT